VILSGRSKIAGVMGWPVSHSRSPRLHSFWLDCYGIDGAYVPLTVPPDQLKQAIRALPALGLQGCNVTLPHKEAAMSAVDLLDPAARRIGAVNTIIVRADGRLEGRNTDAFGFRENLLEAAPSWDPTAAPALLIGCGGAARAVAVALLDLGVPELRLINRTRSKAEELAHSLGGSVKTIPWEWRGRALEGLGLLVNGTTQGMTGQPALDLDLQELPVSALVTDIVYTPLQTPLLQAAAARGNRTVDGLGMLLHQARPGFQAWFGLNPQVTPELRRFVLDGR
jgi:shikimate dehydrogenase